MHSGLGDLADFLGLRELAAGQAWLTRVVIASLAAMFIALSSASGQAETRKLKLYFLHTGEKAEITYKKNGKYIAGGLKKINRFLRDWRRNEPTKMDPQLLDLIWEVYQETGSKKYIHVVSAYRSPATNNLLRKRGRGVAKKSQHTLGKALDFFIPGVNLRKLRNIGLKKGLGGVGYYPKSGSPFVHMDTGRVRHWPRMTRKELARVFPGGKTLHVPTDGKPLARYNQAKAEYERKVKGNNRIVVARAEEIVEKPNFFAKLLGRGEDEEGTTGVVAAPKTVKTTKQPSPQSEPVPATTVPAPATADIQSDTPSPPASAEILLASLPAELVPVPVLAPRATIEEPEPAAATDIPEQETVVADAAAEPTVEPSAEIEIAGNSDTPRIPRPEIGLGSEPAQPEIATEPETEAAETELAYNLPVPSPRPGSEEPGVNIAVQSEDIPAGTDQNITVAALSPGEIEDLRREVYAVLENSQVERSQEESTQIAAYSNDQPQAEDEVTLVAASEALPADTSNKLSLVPQPNPNRQAELVIDRQIKLLEPIEPGVKSLDKPAVPELNPRATGEEILVAALDPLEPGVKTTGRLALPQSNPVEQLTSEPTTLTDTGVPADTVPIPLAAQRPVLVAANTTESEDEIQEIRRLESLQSVSLEERILGKWALAADTSIARIAEIRPPAYARNIIRELPDTVLSRGFVPDTGSQVTNRFSGSSIEFLDFTRFN